MAQRRITTPTASKPTSEASTDSLAAEMVMAVVIAPGPIDEVQASPVPIVMFVDETHTLVGAGGAVLQAIGKERGRMIRSVRECLEILKGSSPDKTMNYDGDMYKVWGYKPEYATDEPPLIYYGSNHPQSRRVAAEKITTDQQGLLKSESLRSAWRGWSRVRSAARSRNPGGTRLRAVSRCHGDPRRRLAYAGRG